MPANGEAAARKFYSELLGIPEREKPSHLKARGGAWFESSTIKIHLGVETNFVPAKKAHPAILVSGLAELSTKLQDAGYEVQNDEPVDGKSHFYVADPFGNRLEFMEENS